MEKILFLDKSWYCTRHVKARQSDFIHLRTDKLAIQFLSNDFSLFQYNIYNCNLRDTNAMAKTFYLNIIKLLAEFPVFFFYVHPFPLLNDTR